MSEKQLVHFNLFNPEHAANTRAEVQTITCSCPDNCELFTRQECALLYQLRSTCPYGIYRRETGYTRRSKQYFAWCREQKTRYKDVGFLNVPSIMGRVGEYIFLPYSYMDSFDSLPWDSHFLKLSDFTVDTVIFLVKARPQDRFGGELTSYQKEVPPKFLKHLSECMPTLFQQVIAQSDDAKRRFQEFSNIGRRAVLDTLTPSVGMLQDIYGGQWIWDGEVLRSKNSHAAFLLVSKWKEIWLVPEPGQVVKITEEGQVNAQTQFID